MSTTTSRETHESLLPCPFCGGNAEILRKGTSKQSMQVRCESCGAFVESGEVSGLTAPSEYRWNRRRAPIATTKNDSAGGCGANRYACIHQVDQGSTCSDELCPACRVENAVRIARNTAITTGRAVLGEDWYRRMLMQGKGDDEILIGHATFAGQVPPQLVATPPAKASQP